MLQLMRYIYQKGYETKRQLLHLLCMCVCVYIYIYILYITFLNVHLNFSIRKKNNFFSNLFDLIVDLTITM